MPTPIHPFFRVPGKITGGSARLRARASPLIPGVAAEDVCWRRHSKSVRRTSSKLRTVIHKEYVALGHSSGSGEIDRLLPIELSGAEVKASLPTRPARPVSGVHEKAEVKHYPCGKGHVGWMTLNGTQDRAWAHWAKGVPVNSSLAHAPPL